MSKRSKRTIAFSKQSIEGIVLPLDGRVEYWDESTPGLSCRVSSNGQKSFYWVGRWAGEWKRSFIGSWPVVNVQGAKSEALRLAGIAAQGDEPVSKAKRRNPEWTLQEMFEWFIETHSKPHKKTWRVDQRIYDTRLTHWARRRVSTITKAEIQLLHVDLGEKHGPNSANKMLEVLGLVYRKGAEMEPSRVPCPDPTNKIKRFHVEARERFLDAAELPKFLAAIECLKHERTKDIFKMLLWTGARRSNVLSMRWDQISMETAIWRVPGEQSKNKRVLTIPLSSQAMEILRRRQKESQSEWVFPGRGKDGHFTRPFRAMAKVIEDAKLSDVRVHDLRRTLGSWLAIDNPLQLVAKQLGHASLKSTQIYARLANQTLKDALDSTTKKMNKTAKKTKKKPTI